MVLLRRSLDFITTNYSFFDTRFQLRVSGIQISSNFNSRRTPYHKKNHTSIDQNTAIISHKRPLALLSKKQRNCLICRYEEKKRLYFATTRDRKDKGRKISNPSDNFMCIENQRVGFFHLTGRHRRETRSTYEMLSTLRDLASRA